MYADLITSHDSFAFLFLSLQVELCSHLTSYKPTLPAPLSVFIVVFSPYCKVYTWLFNQPASYQPIRMSQLQFQAPGNPAPSAAPLQLAPPLPRFSIPCANASLPSESASHPLRNSALPSASATPFCNPTGRC